MQKTLSPLLGACRNTAIAGILLVVLGIYFLSFATPKTATAASSNTINFQARLMMASGAIVPDGNYNVEFKLYNALTSSGSSQGSCSGDSACLWTETRTTTDKVHVANGYLTVELGSVNALPTSIDWSQNMYLTMNIGGTGTPGWDGEMSPRLHLTAVPHAFTADQLKNTNGSFTSTLGFTAPTANRTINLPDESGTLCIQSSTNCGFALSSGSTNYIQNQNASDQTANFRISGTGRANTSLQAPLFDTATATALAIGSTNATAINLNKSTVITGGVTQSGGAISLTGNAASAITTSTGALTLTAAGTSNWTVGGTNQSLTITTSGTGVLTLGTTGAGTVTLGNSSATINIGATNNARTVHIADGGTSTTQTVIMGSANGSSTTTIQGGTGSAAIALTTASGGKISIDSQGSGGITALIGSSGFTAKTTTDSTTAFAIQASNNDYIFSVSTSAGIVTMGAIQATYSGFDGTLNTPLGDLTVGSSSNTLALKGDSGMTMQATSGSFTTTVGFTAPTANRTITMPDESGTVCMRTSTNCGFAAASGSANYIQNTTTLQSANVAVQAASSGSVTAVLQANAAGAGDILQLKNGAGTSVATFSSTGAILFKNSTNSTAAFQVQNAAGANVLLVDTTNERVAIGNVGAPALKFEVQGGDAAIYNSGNNARLVLGDSSTSGQYGYLQWDSTNDYFRIETTGTNGVKIKDNYMSIGNITPSKPLIVGNGTNPLLEVGTTGGIQARTSTNTTTAFQLQNDTSVAYFNGDSTNGRVGIGAAMVTPEVTLDVEGVIQQTGMTTPNTDAADANKWTKLGSCTITAQYRQCLTTLTIIGGHDGSAGNNTQGTVSVRVKQQNAMGGAPYVNVNLNDTAEVITKADIVAVTTTNTGASTVVDLYGRITNTYEQWYYTPLINTGNGTLTNWNWSPSSAFVAALPSGTQTVARYGNLNANLMTVEATNTAAMTIQNAGGTNKLFVADTTNLRIAINQATAAYTLDVAGDVNTTTQYRIGGTAICTATGCTASATSAILNQATVQAANFYVQAASSGSVAGILRANAAGAGNILNLQNGAGTNVGTVSSTGAVTLQNSTNSTSAFLVQASAGGGGNAVLRVDTTNERVAIGVIADPISAKLNIATSTTVSLRAYQGSTNDVFQLANSTGDIFNVGSTGTVNLKTTTNNTNAFRIQNSAGTQVLNVDTTAGDLLLGASYTGKHVAANIGTNAYLEVANSSNEGLTITQFEGSGSDLYMTYDNDLVFYRSTSSATGLRVLDPDDDTSLFAVDSVNSRIVLGTSNTTGTILVLDTKTGSGDPTGVDGAMYYNSNSGKFRCYENGTWDNCISHRTTVLASDVTNNNASACTIASVTGLSFAVTSGVTYRFHAQVIYTAAATTTGSRWAVTGPTTSLLSYSTSSPLAGGSALSTNQAFNSGSAYDIAGCSASSTSTAGNIATIDGIITPSASGTVTVRFASEVASSAIVAKAGSTLEWW